MKPNWRPTFPTNLAPHRINLNPEENSSGIDFGNVVDNAFSLAFRTFIPKDFVDAIDFN